MFKFINLFCLTLALSICAVAQNSGDEYNKNEFFVGYSNQQVDRGDYTTYHGFEGSYVRNVSRYFGIKGDFSAAYKNESFDVPSAVFNGTTIPGGRFESKNSVYNFLGGVQVKDNSSSARFKPFAHALAGIATNRIKSSSSIATSNLRNFTVNSTGFAAAVGGGLDIKINDRFDFRAIQVDYNPVRSFRQFSNNVRFGIGIVIKK
ncbi:MAG: outer membrane beta-barrel protein [Acidobacteriota bacterium]|nr:outer membrane beta-barrel protein [Acidobacteriota bacterium]